VLNLLLISLADKFDLQSIIRDDCNYFLVIYGRFDLKSLKASRVDGFKSKPIIVSSESSISEVMGILKHNNAYEVFIQEGDKVSIITLREILRAADISMKVSSLMFYIPKLSSDDTVGKAAKLMNDYKEPYQ